MTDQNAQDRRSSENRLADAKRRDYKQSNLYSGRGKLVIKHLSSWMGRWRF